MDKKDVYAFGGGGEMARVRISVRRTATTTISNHLFQWSGSAQHACVGKWCVAACYATRHEERFEWLMFYMHEAANPLWFLEKIWDIEI